MHVSNIIRKHIKLLKQRTLNGFQSLTCFKIQTLFKRLLMNHIRFFNIIQKQETQTTKTIVYIILQHSEGTNLQHPLPCYPSLCAKFPTCTCMQPKSNLMLGHYEYRTFLHANYANARKSIFSLTSTYFSRFILD